MIQTMLSTMKNAILAGQTRARVQTFFMVTDYTLSKVPNSESHAIYDVHTMKPFENVRVTLAARSRELTDWLLQQRVHFIMATSCTSERTTFGQPNLANFMHVIALFVPEMPPSLWNAAFLKDDDSERQWNERCAAAIRIGMPYFAVRILRYKHDYAETEDTSGEFVCLQPRRHLTMELLDRPHWKLNERYANLIAWSNQTGYKWTLSIGENWAYFIVLLDPISRYH